MKNYSSQRGVALLTILVMVALATILAATIAKRQTNTAENTGYLMRQDQSLLYAKSAEAFFQSYSFKIAITVVALTIYRKTGQNRCHHFL
jgi:type II secretory pathway component PulK